MNLKNLFSLLAVLLISGMNVLKAQNPYCNPCTNSPCLTVSFGNDCSCPMRWVFTQGSNPVCSESPSFYVDNSGLPPFQIPCLACDLGQCMCATGIKLMDPCSNSAEIFSSDFNTLNPNPLTQNYPFVVNVMDLQISGSCCNPQNRINIKFTFTSPTSCFIETTCI
ncbi:MAG: hypothetical protein RL607_685 [Bacteroidota bacterium]|jgi:hypothetical protein